MKYKRLNKEKVILLIIDTLKGFAATISSSTLEISNLRGVFLKASSTAPLSSIAILITNEYISKLKKRYIKLPKWVKVNSLLYEKALSK